MLVHEKQSLHTLITVELLDRIFDEREIVLVKDLICLEVEGPIPCNVIERDVGLLREDRAAAAA
jgi:hypothetical protein